MAQSEGLKSPSSFMQPPTLTPLPVEAQIRSLSAANAVTVQAI